MITKGPKFFSDGSTVSSSTVGPSINIDMTVDDLLYVRAGEPFKIPASIKGRPVPKVTWDYYGKAKSHKKDKLHTLPEDSQVRLITTRSLFHHIATTTRRKDCEVLTPSSEGINSCFIDLNLYLQTVFMYSG